MQPETIDAEDISKQKEYEILSLVLKDSSKIKKEAFINEELTYIRFIKGIPDSTGEFIYSVKQNIHDSNKTYIHTLVSTNILPLSKVSKVEISKSKIDMTATILFISLPVLLLSALIVAAVMNSLDWNIKCVR
jgi:hypothetical protein